MTTIPMVKHRLNSFYRFQTPGSKQPKVFVSVFLFMLNVHHRSAGHSYHRGHQAIKYSVLTNAPQIIKAVKENVLDHTLKASFGNSTYNFYSHFTGKSKAYGHT